MLPENGACWIAWNTHQPSGGFCWQEYSGSLPAVPLCPECYDSTMYCQQRLAALALSSRMPGRVVAGSAGGCVVAGSAGGCVVANPGGRVVASSGGRVVANPGGRVVASSGGRVEVTSGGRVVANPGGHMGNASGGRVEVTEGRVGSAGRHVMSSRGRAGIDDSQVPPLEKIISSMSIPGSDTQLYLVEIPAPLAGDKFCAAKRQFLEQHADTGAWTPMPYPCFKVRGDRGHHQHHQHHQRPAPPQQAVQSIAWMTRRTIAAAFELGPRVEWFTGRFQKPLRTSHRTWEVLWSDGQLSECDLNPGTYGSRWVFVEHTGCPTWLADEQRVQDPDEHTGEVALLVSKLQALNASTQAQCAWRARCDVARAAIDAYTRDIDLEQRFPYVGDARLLKGAQVMQRSSEEDGKRGVVGTIQGVVTAGQGHVWRVAYEDRRGKMGSGTLRWHELMGTLYRMPPFRFVSVRVFVGVLEGFWWCASRVSNLGRVVAMALAHAF